MSEIKIELGIKIPKVPSSFEISGVEGDKATVCISQMSDEQLMKIAAVYGADLIKERKLVQERIRRNEGMKNAARDH